MPTAINTVSSDQLATAEQLPATPFYLDLDDDSEAMWLCQKVYRHLPTKRIVLKLQRGDITIVGKIFYRKKDYKREVRGQKWLINNRLFTPTISDIKINIKQLVKKSWVVSYEHINTISIAAAMLNMTLIEQQKLLLRCCQTVAKMHACGLFQDDLHLDNFLYEQDKLWIVDCASIKNNNAPLDKKLALRNLGLLLAQTPPEQRPNIEKICGHYSDIYDHFIIRSCELNNAIASMQKRRWSHYKKKLSRNCTEFWVAKNNIGITIVRNDYLSDDLLYQLKNIDQWMASGRQLKAGNTATVAKVCYNGNYFVVKRYNIKNWRHAISRSLRPTRGWNSWHNGNYLRFNEISTPLPVALVEERFGFIKRRAWLITKYANGIDLLTAADPNTLSSPVTSQLPTMVADVVLQLIQANISHGDMKATNFIVTDNGLELIDLDAMRIHVSKAKTITAIKTDIDRLLRNWDDTKVKLSFSSAIDLVLGDDFTPTP